MAAETAAAGVASRLAAARILAAVFDQGRSLKAELTAALPGVSDPRDRALVEAICFAVLRRRPAYDVALRQWLERPLPPRDAELKALLMAGFAQLDVLQLPAHAALSATVEACRALGRPRQAGMVNAVLRRAQREGFPLLPTMPAGRRGCASNCARTGATRPKRSLWKVRAWHRCGCVYSAPV